MSKRKPVNVEIIKRTAETEAADGVYGVMDSIIASCRPDLADVAIGLAWRYGWKPNADGFLRAGFCKKRGDLDRALDAFDFVILLNAEAWPEMTEPERRRLMHHELCHAQVCTDENGDTKFDTSGRPCCRVRKHDIEEFFEVAEIYGMDSTINQIAKAATQDADRPLLKLAGRKAETAEDAENTEDVGATETAETEAAEVLTFKPQGVKQAAVTIRLQRRGGNWRYGFEWQLGNFTDGERIEASDWYEGKALCLRSLLASVAISMADIQITGKADARRATETRRDNLRGQFEDWLEPRIDAAEESEKATEGTEITEGQG
jgi:hypothetical protein